MYTGVTLAFYLSLFFFCTSSGCLRSRIGALKERGKGNAAHRDGNCETGTFGRQSFDADANGVHLFCAGDMGGATEHPSQGTDVESGLLPAGRGV